MRTFVVKDVEVQDISAFFPLLYRKSKCTCTGQQKSVQMDSKGPSGAGKTSCIPFNQPPLPEGTPCFTNNGKLDNKVHSRVRVTGDGTSTVLLFHMHIYLFFDAQSRFKLCMMPSNKWTKRSIKFQQLHSKQRIPNTVTIGLLKLTALLNKESSLFPHYIAEFFPWASIKTLSQN